MKLNTFEKYKSTEKEVCLLSLIKQASAAVKEACAEDLEKARYQLADLKSKVEAAIKKQDKE